MNEKKSKKSQNLKKNEQFNDSLCRVAKGTLLIFVGTIIGMGALFLARILIARNYSQEEYGIFSLSYVVLSIFSTISLMGLKGGVTRQVAHFNGKDQKPKTKGIILTSILSVLIISILLSVFLFYLSDVISNFIFKDEKLVIPLKIVSIAIPFLSLTYLFSSIFRGFERVKEKILFENLLLNILFIILLIPAFLIKINFTSILILFIMSIILNFLFFLTHIYKKKSLLFFERISKYKKNLHSKELLYFSLPLLIISILYMTMSWADSIMLGFFKDIETVGLYNSALPLARLLPIMHSSMGFIYLPIASGLIARNQSVKLQNLYVLISRWILLLTLPLFSILFFFPRYVLSFLFGSSYIGASSVLIILSIGFIFHVILGPNGSTLTAFGNVKIQMYSSVASMVSNIGLNIILIPPYGIQGAAVATAVSLVIPNLILSIELFRRNRLHPFSINYVKPVLFSIIFIIVFSYIFKLFTPTLFLIILYILILLVICLFSVFITKSFFIEDAELIRSIGRKFGINTNFITKFIKYKK